MSDFLEEAQGCLNSGDFECALNKYDQIPDREERELRLCVGYMAKAGLTLATFLDIVTKNNSQFLGKSAQDFVPWDGDRTIDADFAKEHCNAFQQLTKDTGMGGLLRFMGNTVHCAVRLARANSVVAASDGEGACNGGGNNDGKVSKSDISNGSTGMCREDVLICLQDNAELSGQNLNDSGKKTKDNFDSLPPELKNSGTTSTVGRASLKNQVPED